MITHELFKETMEKVDAILQQKEIDIHARPIHAVMEFTELLNIADDIPMTTTKQVPPNFDSEYIMTHIEQWYEKRYGDRLNINMGPGSIVIMIKRSPWELKFPLIYGQINIVCDPDLSKYKKDPDPGFRGEIPTYNILYAIKHMPETLITELDIKELQYILQQFVTGLNALQELSYHASEYFINEAYVDLENAVKNLVDQHHHYGMSKWASLQFTEKILKSVLKGNNINFPNTHNLTRLSEIGKSENIFDVNRSDINKIQCTAGVRYGEEEVSLISAIEAHQKSIKVIGEIF